MVDLKKSTLPLDQPVTSSRKNPSASYNMFEEEKDSVNVDAVGFVMVDDDNKVAGDQKSDSDPSQMLQQEDQMEEVAKPLLKKV